MSVTCTQMCLLLLPTLSSTAGPLLHPRYPPFYFHASAFMVYILENNQNDKSEKNCI